MDAEDYYDSGAYPEDHDASSPPMDDVEEETDTQETLNECLSKFGTADFIMEPEIFSQLKKYFQAGGNPEQVIDLLSKNYLGEQPFVEANCLSALSRVQEECISPTIYRWTQTVKQEVGLLDGPI